MLMKEGKRLPKTEDALSDAILMILEKNRLENIRVRDICEVAQIDRGVFYAYFRDQNDLMNYCLNK